MSIPPVVGRCYMDDQPVRRHVAAWVMDPRLTQGDGRPVRYLVHVGACRDNLTARLEIGHVRPKVPVARPWEDVQLPFQIGTDREDPEGSRKESAMTQTDKWQEVARPAREGGNYWSWENDGVLEGTFLAYREPAEHERGTGYATFAREDEARPTVEVGLTAVLRDYFGPEGVVSVGSRCRVTHTGQDGNVKLFRVEVAGE